VVKLELEISKFKTRKRVWLNIFNIVIKIMYRTTDADTIISSDLTLFLVMQNTVRSAITRKLRSCETSSYRKSRNNIIIIIIVISRSHWPRGLRRESVAARLLGL
jgi:hypothetical protein